MIVTNSIPLIGLAKINKLYLLKELFKEVVIPEEVRIEAIDRGIENNSPDAYVIRKALEDGWIIVQDVKILSGLTDFGIDLGESATLSLARNRGEKEVLIDVRHARLPAKALGLKPLGTIYVLLAALKRGIISYEEYVASLEGLIKSGFRLSEEVYIEAVRLGLIIKEEKE